MQDTDPHLGDADPQHWQRQKKLRGMIFSGKRRKEKNRNAKEAPEQFFKKSLQSKS
jgi:hypothetical protein